MARHGPALVCLMLLSACQQPNPQPNTQLDTQLDRVGVPDPEPEPPPPPDVAYFTLAHGGLVVLDASGWRLVAAERKHAGFEGLVHDGGRVWAYTNDLLYRVEDEGLREELAFERELGDRVEDVVRDGDTWWVLTSQRLTRYADGAWLTTPTRAIAGDIGRGLTLARGDDGVTWVLGDRHAAYQREPTDTWSRLPWPAFPPLRLLARSPRGEVHASDGRTLLELAPENGHELEIVAERHTPETRYVTDTGALEFSPDGVALLVSLAGCSVSLLDPADPGLVWSLAEGEHQCRTVQQAAIDGRRRVWLFADEGLSVIERDKTEHAYARGTVQEIGGLDATDMLVLGDGPPLPPPGPLRTGALTGSLLDEEREPLAGARVQMCTSPAIDVEPCADREPRFSTRTDGRGRFRFGEVPVAPYRILVQPRGKRRTWYTIYAVALGQKMRVDEVHELGSFALDELPRTTYE